MMIRKGRIPIVSLVLLTTWTAASGRIIYVDDDAVGANNGTNWVDAYVCLQDALSAARVLAEPVEIRVAQGIYRPDEGAGQAPGDREATFLLRSGLALRGGYAGLGRPDPDVRDSRIYRSILTGDLENNDDLSRFADIARCWSTPVALRAPGCSAFDRDGDSVLTYEDFRNCLVSFMWYSENSYTVVTARGVDDTCVLDGFLITSGNSCKPGAYGYAPDDIGAGLHVENASLVIRECTFTNNVAGYDGGGLLSLNSSPNIFQCRFAGNFACHDGGAIAHEDGSPVIAECSILDNYAGDDGGGVYLSHEGSPLVRDSRIEGNRAFQDGGGIYCSRQCAPRLANNAIVANIAFNGGGVGSRKWAAPILIENVLTGNLAWDDGGGLYLRNTAGRVTNNAFRDNFATDDGGGIYARIDWKREPPDPQTVFTDNVIVANSALDNGGGFYMQNVSPEILHSVFALNLAEDGGALWCRTELYRLSAERGVCAPVLRNVTLSGNSCFEQGGAICCRWGATLSLFDSIVWDAGESPAPRMIVALDDAQLAIEDSSVRGGWPGRGNIDADPLFVNAGNRDLNGTPDDPTDDRFVEGDYHLKSRGGHWDATGGGWVVDDVVSPCIDAGNPHTPVGDEPAPNGGIVNLGAYGGTAQASRTPVIHPVTEGFETGGFSNLPWLFPKDAGWWVLAANAHSGRFSARAAAIDDNQSATLAVTVFCPPGDIDFFLRVSSEAGYDRLFFLIDGIAVDEWSGEQDWTRVSFPLTAGTHTLEWRYVKDWSNAAGSDTAWIDDIALSTW